MVSGGAGMSYKVKVIPQHLAEGWLSRGSKSAWPTYYAHPGPARKAAEGYVKRHPGNVCHILTWKDGVFVEEVR